MSIVSPMQIVNSLFSFLFMLGDCIAIGANALFPLGIVLVWWEYLPTLDADGRFVHVSPP
jgi:hypothetical protein